MSTIETPAHAQRHARAIVLVILLAAAHRSAPPLAAQSSAPGARDTIAIERVTVLPMDRDTALVDHTVLVTGDRIVWMGAARAARVATNTRRVDGRGRYLIPGLADMHVHLDGGIEELPQFVAAGVTTVRNMRGRPEHLVWRRRVVAGALVGPTIFTSGPTIAGPSILDWRDRGFVTLRTPDDAERVAREQLRAGYDMLKVHSRLTVPVYQRLLAVARDTRIPVVGHVIRDIGLVRALSAGQVSLEHADLELAGGDATRLDEASRAIARSGAWVGTIVSTRDGRCGPPTATQRQVVASLRRTGVKLLAGSDASLGPLHPGTALHCELSTLVRAGLTPYEALVTATRNAGEFAQMHLKERVPFGTVTIGARADLVLLPADPRADIQILARAIGVVRRGVWHAR